MVSNQTCEIEIIQSRHFETMQHSITICIQSSTTSRGKQLAPKNAKERNFDSSNVPPAHAHNLLNDPWQALDSDGSKHTIAHAMARLGAGNDWVKHIETHRIQIRVIFVLSSESSNNPQEQELCHPHARFGENRGGWVGEHLSSMQESRSFLDAPSITKWWKNTSSKCHASRWNSQKVEWINLCS